MPEPYIEARRRLNGVKVRYDATPLGEYTQLARDPISITPRPVCPGTNSVTILQHWNGLGSRNRRCICLGPSCISLGPSSLTHLMKQSHHVRYSKVAIGKLVIPIRTQNPVIESLQEHYCIAPLQRLIGAEHIVSTTSCDTLIHSPLDSIDRMSARHIRESTESSHTPPADTTPIFLMSCLLLFQATFFSRASGHARLIALRQYCRRFHTSGRTAPFTPLRPPSRASTAPVMKPDASEHR